MTIEQVPNIPMFPQNAERTWVLLTEAIPGGWGPQGHANTNDELVSAARARLAELPARSSRSPR
jgi:hypothetical protein